VRLTTILRRAGSFPAADGDFNEHRSGTETRPCLTALVKVTIGVLNDQFIPRQRGRLQLRGIEFASRETLAVGAKNQLRVRNSAISARFAMRVAQPLVAHPPREFLARSHLY